MSPDDRRAMIAQASIPLFVEHGTSLTTRQIADHLGIAEGTIFRAFQDKDSLIRAAVDAFFDQTQEKLTEGLDAPTLDLTERLSKLIATARERAQGVFAMLSLLDPHEAQELMKRRRKGAIEEALAAAFEADADALNPPPERLGPLIRLLVIAASAPHLGRGAQVTDDELVDLALYGLIGRPADAAADEPPDGKDS